MGTVVVVGGVSVVGVVVVGVEVVVSALLSQGSELSVLGVWVTGVVLVTGSFLSVCSVVPLFSLVALSVGFFLSSVGSVLVVVSRLEIRLESALVVIVLVTPLELFSLSLFLQEQNVNISTKHFKAKLSKF